MISIRENRANYNRTLRPAATPLPDFSPRQTSRRELVVFQPVLGPEEPGGHDPYESVGSPLHGSTALHRWSGRRSGKFRQVPPRKESTVSPADSRRSRRSRHSTLSTHRGHRSPARVEFAILFHRKQTNELSRCWNLLALRLGNS